ncbi:MAG: hypothetical protein Q9202_001417 [Teloschistes flavicans]
MTDAWLNFSVSTVQLNSPHPSSDISLFEGPPPGRGLSPECLDIPSQSPKVPQDDQDSVSQDEQDSMSQDEQDSVPQDEQDSVSQDDEDSVPQDDQLNSTNFLSRLESSSVFKTPQGWLVAPPNGTSIWDFKATTVGSETSCDLVTSLCDIYYESGPTAYSMDLSIEDERTASYELVYADDGSWVSGILSCSTAVSDVEQGSITVDEWSPMNDTASSAFSLLTPRMLSQLQDGILSPFGNASKAADIASGWATAYDQSLLASRFSVLRGRPPITFNRDSPDDPVTLATMIPRAPFVTLIVLDLLYATIATVLMIAAVIAVRKGHGVKDAQARLSILAVVAESFESPAWGDDAKKVDMLFAERRGEGTRRIALVKREGGGRRFKQIVVPQNSVNRPLPVIATTAVSPRPAGSQPIATPTERARYSCQTPVRFSDISPVTSREV